MKPKIICICGSSRFVGEMAILRWEMEKSGKIITLGLHLLPMAYIKVRDHGAENEGIADIMDELHLRKIDISDSILVFNKDGYIGESTRREIEYATKLGKEIGYLEPLKSKD